MLAAENDAYGSQVSSRGEVASPGRTVGFALSDFDQDGEVDLADYASLHSCTSGAGASYDPLPAGCGLTPDVEGFIVVDCDKDGDVDLFDFGVVQMCFSGEGNLADPHCGREAGGPAVTQITLNGDSISVDGGGVTVEGTTATIMSSGTYYISGTLNDGQIVVSSTDGGLVELILSGVDITNSTNAPLAVMNAGYASIVLADQTENYLYDAETYVYEDPEEDEPNAALFSKDSTSISGMGTLTVYGNYNDAIASKDDLIITGGTINEIAVDDGIHSDSTLVINGGTITITESYEGIESADITLNDGNIHVSSSDDGLNGAGR